MKYKQRPHKTVGRIDKYKQIDQFIPEAERIANEIYPDHSIPDYENRWSVTYFAAMNRILVKEGLRVL